MITAQKTFETFFENNPNIEFIDCFLHDLNGLQRGKRVPAQSWQKLLTEGVELPASMFVSEINGETILSTGRGFNDADPDMHCIPIPNTIRLLPWSNGTRAQVMLEMMDVNNDKYFMNPRTRLDSILKQFEELGLKAVLAIELEFYIIGADSIEQPLLPLSKQTGLPIKAGQVYHIDTLLEFENFLQDMEEGARLFEIPTTTITSEYSPGQFEINLKHTDNIDQACIDSMLLKKLVKLAAGKNSYQSTFMSKPYVEHNGSGMHIHVSLYDNQGKNVFQDQETLHKAIGGLIAASNESMLYFAPHANSYRRYMDDPNSYVPIRASWGKNNRSVALRIPNSLPEATRIEHRIAGADANPWLCSAALLAGIHYGLTNQIQPPAEGQGYTNNNPAFHLLPKTWESALNHHAESKIIQEYFTKDFHRAFHEVKNYEHNQFQEYITPKEYEWYMKNL